MNEIRPGILLVVQLSNDVLGCPLNLSCTSCMPSLIDDLLWLDLSITLAYN